ncbi:MAG: hypothetical protein GYB49_11545 [Alphaproteobacteria bacterium]|nr:hypothetical protein [Hyphomonas sp.]MBR9807844.1 hypothetical protein [Alphaproteobacteria bacterium]|tara:strand:+ start:202 stop:630 length:429 start_codon:yes stop_codon:yes gene_type:complete
MTVLKTKAPWHLWVLGVLALLWNAVGAFDFAATVTHWQPYMKNFTAEQQDFFYSFPMWQYIVWGLATWGAFIGSVLLLTRSKLALWAFTVSVICTIMSMLYSLTLTDAPEGTSNAVFTVAIILIAILLFVYSLWLTRRGILR